MRINVNTANAEELKQIPGIGDKVAQLLIQFRDTYGVVKREALNLALRGNLSSEIVDLIDFSVPKLNDPFDIDLHCLPSVPKTDSWEPLVSFAHQTASRRSRSRPPSKSKTDDWQQPLTFASSGSRSRSPVELKTGRWQPLSNSVNPSASRRSRSPKPEIFGREELSSEMQGLGLESVQSRFAMLATASASKVSESSTMLAAASEFHELQEQRSCRKGFKPMSRGDKKDMKHPTNETSRPLSGSRQKQSSKPKQTTSGTERRKGTDQAAEIFKSETKSRSHAAEPSKGASSKSSRSKVNRSPSSSGSASRSRSVRRSSRKSDSKMVKSRSSSRSKMVKSPKKKSRSSSRSASRSRPVQCHSRKSDSKIVKKKSHERSYKHSRSSSRSTSRSSSSHSWSSHKRHTRRDKTRHNKPKVHKHRRHASSSVRSQSRSSRSRSHRPKGRSRLCKTKRRSSSSRSRSRSPSKSKSYRTKRSRSRKSKRSSQKHHSLSLDSYTDTSVNKHSNRHGDPRKHPKALRFDGKSNWLSFRKKFDSFRKVMKWSETESKDYLMWSLEGKALDFFTITATDIEKDSFHRIIKKLEARFGVKELTETSKAKFRQAYQKLEESLEDWADRVMTLATPAFVDLPDEYLKTEAIAKFCQGCSDKDAAKHACFEHPSTMEEALNLVKHHQYISQAVDGKKTRRGNEATVNAVQSPSEARIEQLIASALKEFATKFQISPQSNSQSSSTETKQISDAKKKKSMQCFFRKKFGHAKKECRVYKAWLSKQQTKANLNDQGRDGKTAHPSPKH